MSTRSLSFYCGNKATPSWTRYTQNSPIPATNSLRVCFFLLSPSLSTDLIDIQMQSLRPLLSPFPKNPVFPSQHEADFRKACWVSAETQKYSFFTPIRFRRRVLSSSQSYQGYGEKKVEEPQKELKVHVKNADVTTLGNLCVDIVLNVPVLPPSSREEKKNYFERLSAYPPDQVFFIEK